MDGSRKAGGRKNVAHAAGRRIPRLAKNGLRRHRKHRRTLWRRMHCRDVHQRVCRRYALGPRRCSRNRVAGRRQAIPCQGPHGNPARLLCKSGHELEIDVRPDETEYSPWAKGYVEGVEGSDPVEILSANTKEYLALIA